MRAYSSKPANEFEELNIVRLEDALLCANCDAIVNTTLKGRCPVCGSSALLGLSRLLGGTLGCESPESLPRRSYPLYRVEKRAS